MRNQLRVLFNDQEMIARAIHEEGPRGRAVFVPTNCAVLGNELFELELLGDANGEDGRKLANNQRSYRYYSI